MKLLFLSTWFPYPPDNGSKIRVYHLLKALAARHEVWLCGFAFDTADVQGAMEPLSFCKGVSVVRRDPFITPLAVHALRYLSPGPIVNRARPEMRRCIRELALGRVFDAVIASTEVMAAYTSMFPARTARVLEEHNSLSHQMWERYMSVSGGLRKALYWAGWRKQRRYERALLPRFDLCIVVSRQDHDASREMLDYRGALEVVPNGVDCAHNRPEIIPKNPHSLIYNGALTYSANYDAMQYLLADIYPLIRAQEPQVSLTITGSTKGVVLDVLGLDASVHLSGYVDDIRIPVATSAVCVVPLRQGGGTRLKILEAMALGTPVVATTKGAEGLEVVDGEHLLVADTPQAFAAATLRLLRDGALRARLAHSARRLVAERYDWRMIGEQFVDMVEEAVHRRKRRGGA